MDATQYSLQSKRRVDSFDSVASSFSVISMGESIEERIDVDRSLDEGDQVGVENDRDEWEDVADTTAHPDDMDVEIELGEGFQIAVEAALASVAPPPTNLQPVRLAASPRRQTARELLRDYYLARAKQSEESSKNYRSYEPIPITAPVEIPPLRAPERYDVELYERGIREVNRRNAQQALRQFYAERDAANARRALENRANERFVYASQIGSSVVPQDSGGGGALGSSTCTRSLYWETTRLVVNGNAAATASARAVST